MNATVTGKLLKIAACFAAIASLYHLAAVVGLRHGESPWWRHTLFFVVDLALGWGFWNRPRWFVWCFALLCVQQLHSHGQRALDWARAGRVDWISLLVIASIPIALWALVRDGQAQTRK
ncbi:MAG TPA: hypothetical protein VKP30_06225 [Polyangiaceae bacterium]|nr:hypothetical protein [Polyangiaceae bacterium]